MGNRDVQEHLKLRPEILNILMNLSSVAQDDRHSARFDALRTLTELINRVYATIKMNGSEIDGLIKTNNQQLEEIIDLNKIISKLEVEKKDAQIILEKSNKLIRKMLIVEPSLNSKIPQYEVVEVLGEKNIESPVVKKYLKLYKVA